MLAYRHLFHAGNFADVFKHALLARLLIALALVGTAVGACDGFPCTFFNALSWRDDSSPLPVGINPRVTFERMFGETGSADQRARALKQKQSLLDSVSEEVSTSPRKSSPRVGRSTAPMRLSSVDLPLPDAPRNTAKSPDAISSDTSSSTCTGADSAEGP